ncbi:MAG: hypothetical protein ABI616_01985 [Pseudomonadota bacterium]
MKSHISRRAMLAGSGCLGAFGLLPATAAWSQAAAPASAGMAPVCLSMYYMAGDDAKFDRMQYREKHAPLLREIYGDSLDRIELRTAPPRERKRLQGHTEAPMPEPPVLAVESLWIKNLESYAAATRNAGNKIAEDMSKITKARITLQYEQLAAEQGEPRAGIVQGSKCFSSLYPAKDGSTWDTDYYTRTMLPLISEVYGPDALSRVEVCKGVSVPGGGKPVITSAVHMYVKNEQAFGQAGMKGGMRLFGEAAKYTNIMPVSAMYDVYVVG